MIRVRFLDAAEYELFEAVKYLEERAPGLGRRLVEEVLKTAKFISRFPLASAEVRRATRRALVQKFPYGLYYTVSEQEIVVLAVAHLSRRPGYWEPRQT